MKMYILLIDPNLSIYHCGKCNAPVSSEEHDCETKTFMYSKEEIENFKRQIANQ